MHTVQMKKKRYITKFGESDAGTMRTEEVGQNDYSEIHNTKTICLQILLPCLLDREQHLEIRHISIAQYTLGVFLNAAS